MLRMRHPFLPFLTDELWQRLHRPSLFPGESTPSTASRFNDQLPLSIMTAQQATPSEWKCLIDVDAERRMEDINAVVKTSRSLISSLTSLLPSIE